MTASLENRLYQLGFYDLSTDMQAGLLDALCDGVRVCVAHNGEPERGDAGWRGQGLDCHLKHARDHVETAWASELRDPDGDRPGSEIDDDGLHHAAHATARIGLFYARRTMLEGK